MCVVAFTCLELWKVLCSESLYRRRNDLAAMQKRSLVTGEVPLFFDDTPYKRPVSIVRTCVLQFGFVDLSPADSFHEAETSASLDPHDELTQVHRFEARSEVHD